MKKIKLFFKRVFSRAKSKKLVTRIAAILTAVLLVVGGFGLYVNDYYRADTQAIADFENTIGITMYEMKDGSLVYEPEETLAGFIFYPGGKVEHRAYEPLMLALAQRGILCVLLKMPCNLAVLDMNGAKGVQEQFPTVDAWWIGGHSLGGMTSALYAEKHAEEFDALVLLAAYSTADLTKTNLKVVSIYGSEDGVMRMRKYQKCKSNLPENYKEIILQGGCHAQFGMYGAQKSDGKPAMSAEDQILTAARRIVNSLI